MSDLYSTTEFESKYTYSGQDLGAVWTKDATTFRLWAPTATAAQVNLYRSGTPGTGDLLMQLPMQRGEYGTWVAAKRGDLNGVYYTYQVSIGKYCAEACDPYAKATGVNGQRAMVIDLASTNPDGWEEDSDPNCGLEPTDAIIYELHLRDLSMDDSSGIQYKGKFLGLLETGTTNSHGTPTGLDHIKALGVTHLHLLPVFDFGSVDEAHPERPQFNWGYDPVNFNVPEGSYATDPFHGEVRIREFKQMVQGLHRNGISVIMDVVYNHVYDANSFCFNLLVPMYFSRVTDGKLSNGSGCGNDTASERSMVRKYIVDSVCYWAEEYHIDGFRFDLVGLLDVETVNEIVRRVHERHPNVLFYGEGWTLNTQLTKNVPLATQTNSSLTPGFAYFNDTLRDAIRGSTFIPEALGFVTGATGMGAKLDSCFRGLPEWCTDPCQTVNYISCHDNNTFFDRITLATPGRSFADHVRMNRLAAAFYLLAQGIPFLQAGEEMLRSKPDGKGGFVENSFCSPDRINSIKWDLLEKPAYRKTLAYYRGLIAFRKAHSAFRMTSVYDILSNLLPVPCKNPHIGVFHLRGDVLFEPASEFYMIFSAANTPEEISLPAGTWQLMVSHDTAGTKPIKKVKNSITIPPISAAVLLKA